MTEETTQTMTSKPANLLIKQTPKETAPVKSEALQKLIRDIVIAIATAFIAYLGSYTYNAQEERNLMYKAEENRHLEVTSRISKGCAEESVVIVEKSK